MMRFLKTFKLFEAKLDTNARKVLLYNLKDRLDEYKLSILNNIKYDKKTKTHKLIHFDKLDIKFISNQLKNEITTELYNELNMDEFLNKINEIMISSKDHLKNRIINEFNKKYKKLI